MAATVRRRVKDLGLMDRRELKRAPVRVVAPPDRDEVARLIALARALEGTGLLQGMGGPEKKGLDK